MFNIFKSNQMENLMAALVCVLQQVPDDPMQPEWIGVQSKGMQQWITLQVAQHLGVCANTKFVFPRQMVDYVLAGFEPLQTLKEQAVHSEGVNQDQLFWSILKQIKQPAKTGSLAGIADYIKSDTTGKKLFQLALKMAGVFDDYQIYRPEMLLDWQQGKVHSRMNDPMAVWQAELWKTINLKMPHHLAFDIRMFLDLFLPEKMIRHHLPERMSLFGVSSLPVQFLQVFEKISAVMDIHLFLLVPSNQYFFDIQSSRQLDKIALNAEPGIDPQGLYYEMTNPLLSSLGTSVKTFCSLLEAFDYSEPGLDLFCDPITQEPGNKLTEDCCMLNCLQSDILNLIHRKQDSDNKPILISDPDRSVQIHACHSPMRETQVLKDLLLDEFEHHPDLAPHDVIVMMPDIEAYAPFIESTFTLENALPFAISDRKNKSGSELLKAFLKLLALKNSRFERGQVLDLLLSEPIAQKFGITSDEISKIEQMVTDAGILWGKNADHRKSLGLPGFEENTWEFGLGRLFMGMAMAEGWDELVAGFLPCQSLEGLELEILGKFADFCNCLFTRMDAITKDLTIEQWCWELKTLVRSLMEHNDQNSEDFNFLFQTIDQIGDDAAIAEFSDTLSSDIIFSLVEQKLDLSIAYGNFMAGKITFCNIMPMRSIPFKIVVLMGMDEKSFPRKTFGPGFDLIKKYPWPGDKIDRNEDRYLFLESLLSARSKFIITYTGMSIKDNSLIPCSGVVSELAQTIDQSFKFSKERDIHCFHPLAPFDESYYLKGACLRSYSRDNLCIARSLFQVGKVLPAFVQNQIMENGNDVQSVKIPGQIKPDILTPGILTQETIPLDDIIRFYKHPLKTWVQDGLNLQIPELTDVQEDRESFSISGLEHYLLGTCLLEKFMDQTKDIDLYPFFKAMGKLPFGEKGRMEYERIKQNAFPVIEKARQVFNEHHLPPLVIQQKISGITIEANVSDIKENARYVLTYGRLNASRLVSAWIVHLFYMILAPDRYPKKTILIGRDPDHTKPVAVYGFNDPGPGAMLYFENLIRLFCQGSKKPVILFCETAWQFVLGLARKNFDTSVDSICEIMNQSKIKNTWSGNRVQTGEKQDRINVLCMGNNDLFDSADTLLASGFVDNALTVYKPLFESLEIQS
ncbi:MAG: exodeoxyribonuclease V subunit gamma [Pseudomonadota bacterium]